ncbi:MAG: FGGY-family carbohydrate kinase, partial [Lachnospiraceae bacterium]|nr:FGGY-family carbohydrate kinase [Lachnospiraceae bacterium]
DLNAWVNLFDEFCGAMGIEADKNKLYGTLYRKAMEGDADCGGLLAYNFFSGEPIAGTEEGRPLFVRKPDSAFTLANFMRVHLFTALGALKIGNDILSRQEHVRVDRLMAHGGLFKTRGVGQNILAAAMNAPVTCMTTAGEGGAWGIALLASFLTDRNGDESLGEWLDRAVFAGAAGETVDPDPRDVEGFDAFIERYRRGLPAEYAAIENMR